MFLIPDDCTIGPQTTDQERAVDVRWWSSDPCLTFERCQGCHGRLLDGDLDPGGSNGLDINSPRQWRNRRGLARGFTVVPRVSPWTACAS